MATALHAAARDHSRAARAHDKARAHLDAAVRDAVAEGMTEVEAARVTGLNRLTVRRILGKSR